MTGRLGVLGLGLAALAGLVVVGCGDSSSGGTSFGGGGGGSTGSTGTSSGGTQQPVLVIVDTNQTMTASPGEGVGVFVEYQSGGHWHVWWTCDTYKTSLNCNFDVIASVTTGTITNAVAQSSGAGDAVNQEGAQQVEARTTTSTAVDGMTFDTPLAGQALPIITVNASIDGAESGSFLFFVQDGKINGGYTGTLTDPLEFEPSSP